MLVILEIFSFTWLLFALIKFSRICKTVEAFVDPAMEMLTCQLVFCILKKLSHFLWTF